MSAPRPTAVIVGAGSAGVAAAGALRTAGYEGRVLLAGAEPELPYRRPPVSKEVLRGERTPDQVRIKPAGWYDDQDIELVVGATVTDLDPAGSTVHLDGTVVRYDRLLLATGGRARTLPGAAGLEGIVTLRSAADVPALHGHLAAGRPLLVVGAGLIGAEIAASARSMGCDVEILEAAPTPLSRLLPPMLARLYTELHRDHGVELHVGVGVERVAREGDEVVVTALDGRRWAAGMVVVAVGMVPETGLAEAAGLEVADGIVVDGSCATSAPGIYAAGDVANSPNVVLGGRHRVEHFQHAGNQGAAAGRAMAGQEVAFGEVPWCWSDQYGVNLQVTGWPAAGDDVAVRGDLDAHDFLAVFGRDGRLRGAVGIGRPAEIRAARKIIADAPRTALAVLGDDGTDLAALAGAGAP